MNTLRIATILKVTIHVVNVLETIDNLIHRVVEPQTSRGRLMQVSRPYHVQFASYKNFNKSKVKANLVEYYFRKLINQIYGAWHIMLYTVVKPHQHQAKTHQQKHISETGLLQQAYCSIITLAIVVIREIIICTVGVFPRIARGRQPFIICLISCNKHRDSGN